uniref:FAD-dependent oxidoreductase n=1 Tax=uncultured Altererythrobacter sp. TaxID=500840 RepID=UPI002602EB11|nr:NAD(P)/FAD-dependent oxidoreductase [uncultured Altererythrobacter sp.]
MDSMDIAIAGCGPAGIATALLLNTDGHRVTIFDRFETPSPLGSGLMIQPSGMAVLARLGLAEAVAKCGARIDALKGIQQDGRVALDAPYAKFGSKEVFGLGIHRASLFNCLYQAALSAGIGIETGNKITRSKAEGQRRRLIFANGSSSDLYDLVVDAMGWRSPLTGEDPPLLPYGALWGTVPLHSEDPFAGNLLEQRYRYADQMVGVLPIGRRSKTGPEEAAFFWSLRGDQYASWRDAGLDAWKQEVAALWPETRTVLDRINSPDQLTFARYAHRTAPRFSDTALVHIGDAWHSASPQLGQGANMALLDAWALAFGMRHSRTIYDGLRLAHSLRGDHVWLYQLITALFTPLYQSDKRWHAGLRDRLIAPLSRLGPIARIQAHLMSGLFGFPLQPLGLELPDYPAIASSMAAIASSEFQ